MHSACRGLQFHWIADSLTKIFHKRKFPTLCNPTYGGTRWLVTGGPYPVLPSIICTYSNREWLVGNRTHHYTAENRHSINISVWCCWHCCVSSENTMWSGTKIGTRLKRMQPEANNSRECFQPHIHRGQQDSLCGQLYTHYSGRRHGGASQAHCIGIQKVC